MCKELFDLAHCNSRGGEPWDLLPTIERHFAGFQAWGGASSDEVTQEEGLVDMEQHRGMRMLVAIVQRNKLTDLRLKARLLPYFPYYRLRRGLPNLGPPAWERPQAIGALTDEQHAVRLEDRATDVHLGGRVPRVLHAGDR